MWIRIRRKFAMQISRRVNSSHLLFIGEGRTGADSPMDHQKYQTVYAVWYFCLFRQGESN